MPTTRVETPDGQIITVEHPEGATQEEILAYAQQNYTPQTPVQTDQPTATQTFGTFAARQAGNVALDVAEGVINRAPVTPRGFASAAKDVGSLFGFDLGSIERLTPRTEVPSVADISSFVKSIPSIFPGGESPREAFRRNRAEFYEQERAMEQAHPTAAQFGRLSGDIAGMVAGRQPIARRLAQWERSMFRPNEIMFGKAVQEIQSTPGARRFADRALNAPAVRRLGRGVFRAGETGFEAAMMESLQGDDPLSAAAVAAGTQLGSSAALQGMKGLFTGGPVSVGGKLALTAGGIMALAQTFKSATPGGRDRILESAEFGFDKVALGLALGMTAGAIGGARYRDAKFAEDFPRVVDAMATIPRGAAISVLTRWNDADSQEQSRIEEVLQRVMNDPAYAPRDEFERGIINDLRQ